MVKQERYAEAERLALECHEDALRYGNTKPASEVASVLATIHENLGDAAEAGRRKARAAR